MSILQIKLPFLNKPFKKGQSSLEFGAFFALSLMISLIVITLVGKFSNFGVEGRVEESKGYWYAKKPIAVENMIYYSDGSLVLLLRNKDVEDIRVYNITTDSGVITINSVIPSSKAQPFNATGFSACNASEREVMTLDNVVIYYKKPHVDQVLSTSGTIPLRAYCIPAPSSSSSDDGGGDSGGGCAGGTIIYSLILLYYLRFI